jgi:hypothetical protein
MHWRMNNYWLTLLLRLDNLYCRRKNVNRGGADIDQLNNRIPRENNRNATMRVRILANVESRSNSAWISVGIVAM